MPPAMTSEKLPAPRRVVGKFEPYLPGRSLEGVKKEHGLKRVVKLASNENALGPSPKAVAAVREAAAKAHLYPDGFSADLREAVARHAGLPTTQVVLGAGSDELIELLGRAYLSAGDNVVVSRHAFIRYKMAADIMDAETIEVPMGSDLKHDLPAMARAVTLRTKLVFVANPNNPTGSYNTTSEVAGFLKSLPNHVLAVLDEAYYEYARVLAPGYADGLSFLKDGSRVVVLRTFSKAYALAGLRLGWGGFPRDVADALERIRPPFNINAAAQAAGAAALADRDHVRRSVKVMAAEMKKVKKALASAGFECWPSAANFLLIKTAPRPGREVFEALLMRGVIIRALDEYGLGGYVRVTIGLPSENRLFLKAWDDVMGGRK